MHCFDIPRRALERRAECRIETLKCTAHRGCRNFDLRQFLSVKIDRQLPKSSVSACANAADNTRSRFPYLRVRFLHPHH